MGGGWIGWIGWIGCSANHDGTTKKNTKNNKFPWVILWEARYGSKKNGNGPELLCRSVFFSWPPTEMRSFLKMATEKTQTYGGTVHAFGSTVQNLSLRTRCAQAKEDQITATSTAMATEAAADEHYDYIYFCI